MRVLVTGAYGLIGSAVLARLRRGGHDLIAAGRSIEAARRRAPFARWVEADFNRLTRPEDWLPLLDGVDAVVNCVGVLQDGAGDRVRRVQVTATNALFTACERRGVKRAIHISAVGAERGAPTKFARSKAIAEEHLQSLDLDWAILRPGLVIAPAAYGGTAMLRGLAGLPWRIPLVSADARIQIVGVDDLAETVSRCLAPDAPVRVRWDIACPQEFTLARIVVAFREWLGLPPRPFVTVPRGIATLVSRIADALGYLGWRSPARTTALKQLSAGVLGDPLPWMAATGIRPKSLDDVLAQMPASVADRWFARLYLLKPVAIAGLALFWLLTGLIALGPGRDAALGHLLAAGFPAWFAEPFLIAGALLDVVLGLMLLVRRTARLALLTMLAATPFYLLAGTLFAPQLWLDPLGPLLKVVPMLVATALTLAIMDDR
ncbi:MAG: SDR family oxidoreductase [Alphaproteobacteria bacterium]|nr:SDR family oxidoreductase [Alphaproteobacteria bacterium]